MTVTLNKKLVGQYNLARDLALAAPIELYGLHFSVDWDAMFAKDMIIQALDVNEDVEEIFTTAEVELLESRLIDLYF